MRRTAPSGPRGVLEVDWPFFGELCRALALRVAAEYQPEVVLGVAKAGVIPGVVVASILQCEFASMVVTRREADEDPVLVSGPPATVPRANPTAQENSRVSGPEPTPGSPSACGRMLPCRRSREPAGNGMLVERAADH